MKFRITYLLEFALDEFAFLDCPIRKFLRANAAEGLIVEPNAFHAVRKIGRHKCTGAVSHSLQNVAGVDAGRLLNPLVILFALTGHIALVFVVLALQKVRVK